MGAGQASNDPLAPEMLVSGLSGAPSARVVLIANEAPAEIVGGRGERSALSVDRLPVMHIHESLRWSGDEGRLSQLVSLIASTSADVRLRTLKPIHLTMSGPS